MIRSSLLGWAHNVARTGWGQSALSQPPHRIVRGFSNAEYAGYSRFRPRKSLKFDRSGKSLTAFTKVRGYYLFCSLTGGVIGLVLLKGLHGLYPYKEMGWFRRIFWFLISAGCVAAAYSLHCATREVITK